MNVFISPQFEPEYERHPLVLVDVGARGGLKKNWQVASEHLRVVGFEPDVSEFRRLTGPASGQPPSNVYVNAAVGDRPGTIRLHVTRDPGLSSVFEPNREFLDAFPEPARFDIVDVRDVAVDTLDTVLQSHGLTDIDFIKADTQGSELLVLRGASATLATAVVGLEVEVEFAPIYRGQPLFADVDAFVRGFGFQLFDLRPVYWKRAAGRRAGGPRGQLAWADALYFKSVPALQEAVRSIPPGLGRSKLLRAVSVSVLYGYLDYALDLVQSFPDVLTPDERFAIERSLRAGESTGLALPGRRLLAAALHRLWRYCAPRNDGWSISRAEIGNLD